MNFSPSQGWESCEGTAKNDVTAIEWEHILDIQQVIFELIDMRSFSNLWYWVMLAVVWSIVSHWVLGVPYDLIQRARREGGQAQIDLEDHVRININRIEHILDTAGIWLLAVTCFVVAMLFTLAVFYDFEFATAVLLILVPLVIVSILSIATARLIQREDAKGELLQKILSRHRIYTQAIGMLSVFISSVVGMVYLLARWSV